MENNKPEPGPPSPRKRSREEEEQIRRILETHGNWGEETKELLAAIRRSACAQVELNELLNRLRKAR